MTNDERVDLAMKEGRAVGNLASRNCWICNGVKADREYHDGRRVNSMLICPRCDGPHAQARKVRGTF